MKKRLFITESPNKVKTIEKILKELGEKNISVMCTTGHLFDLPKTSLGLEKIENKVKFNYTYKTSKAKELAEQIKNKAIDSDAVLIATDPDREGEAIAFSLIEKKIVPTNKALRLLLTEITKKSIEEAIKNPTSIDEYRVNSQRVRRAIDRLVGYRLSYMISKLVAKTGIGRVQTTLARIINQRETEITNFIPKEYYKLLIDKLDSFSLHFRDKSIENSFETLDIAKNWQKVLTSDLIRINTSVKQKLLSPPTRLTTADVLREMSSKYGFSTRKTTLLLQSLYEGKSTGFGTITYPRTDSARISDEFIEHIKKFIITKYGEKNWNSNGVLEKQKVTVKFSQNAHECIRPTTLDTSSFLNKLTKDEKLLFKVIFNITIASFMQPEKIETTSYYYAKNKDSEYTISFSESKTIEEGFTLILSHDRKVIPDFLRQETIRLDIEVDKAYTKPPVRYSEGKIIEIMKSEGIGRPSTYSYAINILLKHELISVIKKQVQMLKKGIALCGFVDRLLDNEINVSTTAELESKLDKVENGQLEYNSVIINDWNKIDEKVEEIRTHLKTWQTLKLSLAHECEKCKNTSSTLMFGMYGQYLKCEECGKTVSLQNFPFTPIEIEKQCGIQLK